MANLDVMYSSKTDQWATPKEFFDELNAEFEFDLDPCADESNHKCEKYFTREQNGLLQEWGGPQSILQSSIRKRDRRLGAEMLRRGPQRKYIGCDAHTGPHRYKILP